MPTFHFHVDDGDSHSRDEDGVELPSLQVARREATRLAGELLRDRPDDVWTQQSWRMTVTDDGGTTLFKLQVGADAAPAAQQALDD